MIRFDWDASNNHDRNSPAFSGLVWSYNYTRVSFSMIHHWKYVVLPSTQWLHFCNSESDQDGISNSKFRKLDFGRWVINDPKKSYIPIFSKKLGFFKVLSITLDCHLKFSKSDSRFVISDPKNAHIPIFSQKIGFFSKLFPSYWIHHFEFSKSDSRFVISEHKNAYIPIFTKKLDFFQNFLRHIWSAILEFANLIEDS